nr:MAG TPA: hypothetical protein [Caudoviricetes sp.]
MFRELLPQRPKGPQEKTKNHGQHKRVHGSVKIVFLEGTTREQKGTP